MVNVVERFLFSRFSKLVNYVQKRTGALSQRACSVGRATEGVTPCQMTLQSVRRS